MTQMLFKRLVVATLVAVLVGGTLSSQSPAASRARIQGPYEKVSLRDLARARSLWVDDEVLVDFAPGRARERLDQVDALEGATIRESVAGTDLSVVHLPDETSVQEALDAMASDPAVESVEPNLLIYPSQTIPNDPRFDDLWGLHNTGQNHPVTDPPPNNAQGNTDADIDAPEAWDLEQGDAGTVIAVTDTGVAVNHPDLNASIWTNPGEIAGNGIDDDSNGFIDDVHGWDFGQEDKSLLETDSSVEGFDHGTHVAGTIAAEMDNSTGVTGICPACKIMVLKFMRAIDSDSDGDKDVMEGRLSDELEALTYARKEGADIMNASFSTSLFSAKERRAYVRLGNSGVLTVAAAGNSSLDNDMPLAISLGNFIAFSPEYPASFTVPTILSVAASNHNDQYGYSTGCATAFARWRCAFTNWGHDSVDVAAPGVDVLSSVPATGYDAFNGTSMATPHVVGVAGLVKSEHPGYSPVAVKNAIMNSVDKPDSLKKLYAFPAGPVSGRFTRTSGRVNASDALTAGTGSATPRTDGNIDGAKRIRRRIRGHISWPADINDVFYKKLRKGKKYKAKLDGPNNRDFDLYVWKPGTLEIWQLEKGCFRSRGQCKRLRYADTPNTADETVTFTAKRSKRYYIHVSAWLRNSGRFLLKVKRV
jgi:subtilisin family serine protease